MLLFYHVLFPSLAYAAFNDLFTIKAGASAQGGCSNDQINAIQPVFTDTVNIIDAALKAFNNYENDLQVRMIAFTFFGIQMNDQIAVPKDEDNIIRLQLVNCNESEGIERSKKHN